MVFFRENGTRYNAKVKVQKKDILIDAWHVLFLESPIYLEGSFKDGNKIGGTDYFYPRRFNGFFKEK
jgi:hypothetical protein